MIAQSSSWVGLKLAGGRYEVTRALGEGGMALVYHAIDRNLDADVVIKTPRAVLLEEPEFANRFRREIRSLVHLSHPHIVKVTDVGDHAGIPFAIMQFLPGGSLDDRIPKDAMGQPLPMPAAEVAGYLTPLASALDFVHAKGYVHRDVKPANVLFDEAGNVYLGDFGIAKAANAAEKHDRGLTGTGAIVGTVDYMSPEALMAAPVTGAADQYSLAVAVFELLCGRKPFEGNAATAVMIKHTTQPPPLLVSLVPTIPKDICAIVRKALAKSPDERFANCTAFADAFFAATQIAIATVPEISTKSDTAKRKAISKSVTAEAPLPSAAKKSTASMKVVRTTTVETPALPPPAMPAVAARESKLDFKWLKSRWVAAGGAGCILVASIALMMAKREPKSGPIKDEKAAQLATAPDQSAATPPSPPVADVEKPMPTQTPSTKVSGERRPTGKAKNAKAKRQPTIVPQRPKPTPVAPKPDPAEEKRLAETNRAAELENARTLEKTRRENLETAVRNRTRGAPPCGIDPSSLDLIALARGKLSKSGDAWSPRRGGGQFAITDSELLQSFKRFRDYMLRTRPTIEMYDGEQRAELGKIETFIENAGANGGTRENIRKFVELVSEFAIKFGDDKILTPPLDNDDGAAALAQPKPANAKNAKKIATLTNRVAIKQKALDELVKRGKSDKTDKLREEIKDLEAQIEKLR